MDPNLFAIDTERLFEVLTVIVTLSFLVERALAVLFENRWFVERYASKGLKEPITVLVAFGVCRAWDFDALSIILVKDKTQLWGHLFTAAIIAGGSKGAVKLFHDVFKMMSSAERERQELLKARAEAKPQVPIVIPVVTTAPATVAAARQPATTAEPS